jgi:flagellar basal-body rod protein FlgG
MRSLSIAATGMLAQQLNVEVISNNIANVNTTSYKRQRAEFQDLLYQNQRRVGSSSSSNGTVVPTGIQLGLGVKAAGVYRISAQGNLASTDNTLDVAVQGNGYFQVTLPNGETAFTRAGSFQLSPTGTIVTAEGYNVMPSITIPPDAVSVTINSGGDVLVHIDGQIAEQNVGTFDLANFANPAGLQMIGGNLLLQTPASGAPKTGVPGSTGFGTLLQGFLETSNVNVVQEITNLITAQRAYEMNSKVIEASDQMMQQLNQIRA